MENGAFKSIIHLIQHPISGTKLSDKQWESIIFICRQTNLLASLYYLIQDHQIFEHYSTYAKKHLHSAKVYADRQAQQVVYEALEIKYALGKQQIEPVFLKGASYTLRKSKNSKGRIYSDIDVLVKKEELIDGQKALQQAGWHSKKLNDHDEKYYREWAHEIPAMFHIHRGTVIDLHHNIVPPISGRAPNIEHFYDATELTPEGYRILSAPASTLHSCVHLFSNEDFSNGFRDLLDLHRLIEEYGDKNYWQDLINLAKKTGFSLELYYATSSLKSLLNTKIPDEIQNELSNQFSSIKTHFLIHQIFIPALRPHHPLVFGFKSKLSNAFVYMRGHWIKMPLAILISHLSVKAFFNLRDYLFGKHQFEKD